MYIIAGSSSGLCVYEISPLAAAAERRTSRFLLGMGRKAKNALSVLAAHGEFLAFFLAAKKRMHMCFAPHHDLGVPFFTAAQAVTNG